MDNEEGPKVKVTEAQKAYLKKLAVETGTDTRRVGNAKQASDEISRLMKIRRLQRRAVEHK